MKNYIKLLILGMLLPYISWGQTPNMNYVQSTSYTAPTQTENVTSGKIDVISYMDGLGRPIQKIAYKAGGGRIKPYQCHDL